MLNDLLRVSSHVMSPRAIFGRPFVKRFALCCRSVVCLSCLSVSPLCDVGVLWPNGWTDQDETWHAGRLRPWSHSVRWGPSSPPLKGDRALPSFRPISVLAKWLDGLRCHLIWRPERRRLCVTWRPSSSFPQNEAEPPIFRHVYCGLKAKLHYAS